MTIMTSEFLKYLNEQLGVFLNVKQQKWSELKTKKRNFDAKTFFYNVMFYQILMLSFWTFSRSQNCLLDTRTFLLCIITIEKWDFRTITPKHFEKISWHHHHTKQQIFQDFGTNPP